MFAARDRASAAEFRTGELSVYAEGPAAHVDGEVCERQLKILVRRLNPVPRRRGRRARAGGKRGPASSVRAATALRALTRGAGSRSRAARRGQRGGGAAGRPCVANTGRSRRVLA